MAPKSKYKRGFAVAGLIGFEQGMAVVWRIYSQVVKLEATVRFVGVSSDSKALYNFHESIVNSIRGILKEGVRSIILVSPPRTVYGERFAEHIKDHHAWLTQGTSKVALTKIIGSAVTRSDLTILARKPDFRNLVQDATFEETENLLELLERSLNSPNKTDVVLYSLEDVENSIVYSREKITLEFLLLTDEYLGKTRQKGRLNRLMQVAASRKVKTRIVDSNVPAGKRLTQLGGIALIAKRN